MTDDRRHPIAPDALTDVRRCEECGAPVAKPKRKYCATHSARASAIWKRRFRAELRARGEQTYRDYWESDEARRAYHREAMRRWRARRKALSPEASRPPPGTGRGGGGGCDRHGQAA